MKSNLKQKLTAALLIILRIAAASEGRIKIAENIFLDAYFRPRVEIDGRDFAGTGADAYANYRTRLGISLENLIENTELYLQIADSRMMGFDDPYMQGSNIGMNKQDNNLGVNKAYIKIKEISCPGTYFMVGRMPNDQGRQRIFGPGDWNFTGPRVYDGAKMGYAAEKWSVNLWYFWGKSGDRHWIEEMPYFDENNDENNEKLDHSLIGVDGSFLNKSLNAMLFLDWDQNLVAADTAIGGSHPAFTRWTSLIYYTRQFDAFNLDLDAAYQFGEKAYSGGSGDIAAWFIAPEITYNFDYSLKPWIGLACDIVSGENSDTSRFTQFYEEYYSKHRFQGRMDYFTDSASKSHGLQDYILKFGCAPLKNFKTMWEAHYFRSEYAFPSVIDSAACCEYGWELDITSDYTIRKGLKSQIGLNFFLPNENWQGKDAKWTYFFYTHLLAEL